MGEIKTIEDINFEEIVNVDFYTTKAILVNGRGIEVFYKDNTKEYISCLTLYPEQDLPESEIFKTFKLKLNNKIEATRKERKELKSYYEKELPMTMRKGEFVFFVKKDSTWADEEDEKRKSIWDSFYKEFKEKYNNSRVPTLKKLKKELNQKRKEVKDLENKLINLM